MHQIDIDFDVYKELTNRRTTEDVTYNDVVRQLLSLPPSKTEKPRLKGKPWIVSDTSFPSGTDFLADYKGKSFTGLVKDGKLQLADGHTFTTPSAAATHITGSAVNGWRFWKCRLPGVPQYVLIERLRGKSH